ncbi:acetyltransferase [Methanobacterium sp.]|uniref:acetyltransferase n=1 Tax=Methanobacterium sp. TaxID=2164 RepID=UPI002ABCE1D6|nr:acetyltransferase [Methanobacterium sp.]MDY9922729.1 acetyltransferase [Methanobacterium sp.]
MGKNIFILGAGGFARETLDICISLGKSKHVIGFLEENCKREGEILNGKPIHDLSMLDEFNKKEVKLVGAIGTPLRKRLIEDVNEMGFKYETLIHPNVIMSEWVKFGKGCIVCAGNILTNQINIENHVILNLSCTVGHNVNIKEYTTISPGVNISGNVKIGSECFVGTGAVMVEKIEIGNGSFIAAGAVVTRDIPNNVLAVGVPAKPVKKLSKSDWNELI